MAEICVQGLKYHAYHGCHPSEQSTGGKFEVDILVVTPGDIEAKSDEISDAIDYVRLMAISAEQIAVRSNLIETVAFRIATAIKGEYPLIERVEVTLRKMNAPVQYDHDFVSVKYVVE